MTAQEVFDKVYRHLLTQKAKSNKFDSDGEEYCMYRGPNGLKCAVGCLIADEEYSEKFEGVTISHLLQHNTALSKYKIHRLLLKDLQCIHDTYDVNKWPSELAECALKYDLNIPNMENSHA